MQNKKKQLNICIVGDASSPHIQNRTECLFEKGHKITILTPKQGLRMFDEILINPPKTLISKLLYKYKIFFQIKNILKKLQPDIVHIHYACGFQALAAAVLSKCPVVVTVMGGDILFNERRSHTFTQRLATKIILKHADFITAKSFYLLSEVKKIIKSNCKTARIIWGVKPSLFFSRMNVQNLRAKLNIKETDRVIFCPRGLKTIHNIDNIIKAVFEVRKRDTSVKLVVSRFNPDEEYSSYIQSLIDSLALKDAVILVDKIEYKDMPLYYNLADASISISSTDGFPHFIMESMACGTPNIISNLERYREFVSSDDVIFVDSTKIKMIADSISKLLWTNEFRAKLIDNGFSLLKQIGHYERETEKVQGIYYELIDVR